MEMHTETAQPLWGSRNFRMLAIAMVVTLTAMAVIIFEIGPRLRSRESAVINKHAAAGRPVFAPPAAASGPRDVLFDGVLDKAKDETPIGDADWDESRIYLARHLKGVQADSLAARSLLVDNYRYFARHPADLRGRTARLTGMLVAQDPIRIPPEASKVTGVEWIYRTYLVSMTQDAMCVIDLMEPFLPGAERRPLVVTDAIFLKIGTYEGKKELMRLPYLMGRRIDEFKPPVGGDVITVSSLLATVGIVSVLIVGYLTYGIWRRSRPCPPKPLQRLARLPEGEAGRSGSCQKTSI